MSLQLFRRSPDAIFSEVGSDVVALHLERGQCYGMERVSATVWGLLAEATSVDAICDHLVAIYDVEPDACRSDVDRLMEQLRSEGLVESLP